MKRIIFLPALLAIVSCAYAQPTFTPAQNTVNQVVIDIFDALANGDTVLLKKHCTADILILEDKEVWNIDTLVLYVGRKREPDYKRINTFEFIETKIEGKTAWTSYYNQAEITRKGKKTFVRWLETAILVRDNRSWKMRVLHSTLVKRC